MRVTVPDYFDQFRCLAGDCPHTCCEKWEVVIDEETAAFYGSVTGPLGEQLRRALVRDEDGDPCFALNGGKCPFLDADRLCRIHRELGEQATSVTCREHPRFTEEYGPFREITLAVSCPAANRLLLSSSEPLRFCTLETDEPEETGDPWLAGLVPLRERMIALLQDRKQPLRCRLRDFLLLAEDARLCLEEAREAELPALAAGWQPTAAPETAGDEGRFLVRSLRLLASLEVLEEDWRTLLEQGETATPEAVPEPLLERIAVYFAFRYLLKAVNDGDLSGRAHFCVFAVLVIRRLSGVCGLSEALRRFGCEIEHDEENLDALLEAFRWEEGLQIEDFLAALST